MNENDSKSDDTKKKKKLVLRRETLRKLSDDALKNVRGGERLDALDGGVTDNRCK
jgi:hypothetical protein